MKGRKMWRSAALFFVVVSLAGCATARAVDVKTPSGIQQQIRAGDQVRITTKSDATYAFKVEATTDAAIVGTADDKRQEIPYDSIKSLSVTKEAGNGESRTSLGWVGLIAMGLMMTMMVIP